MRRSVVFDVNMLVSTFIAPGGAPARSVQSALINDWDVVYSSHILNKLAEVLKRPKFRHSFVTDEFGAYVAMFRSLSRDVIPDPTVVGVAPDEEDDRVLGTAVAARADFLVTGDKGLLAVGQYRGVSIVTAPEFLMVIGRLET